MLAQWKLCVSFSEELLHPVELVDQVLGCVFGCVFRFCSHFLFRCGRHSLLRFDPHRGTFALYLGWWMKNIAEAIAASGSCGCFQSCQYLGGTSIYHRSWHENFPCFVEHHSCWRCNKFLPDQGVSLSNAALCCHRCSWFLSKGNVPVAPSSGGMKSRRTLK